MCAVCCFLHSVFASFVCSLVRTHAFQKSVINIIYILRERATIKQKLKVSISNSCVINVGKGVCGLWVRCVTYECVCVCNGYTSCRWDRVVCINSTDKHDNDGWLYKICQFEPRLYFGYIHSHVSNSYNRLMCIKVVSKPCAQSASTTTSKRENIYIHIRVVWINVMHMSCAQYIPHTIWHWLLLFCADKIDNDGNGALRRFCY